MSCSISDKVKFHIMRKKIFFISFIHSLLVALTFAQSPESFNYQAVLRDASGNIKANLNTNIRIDLLQGSANGTDVFSETFATKTNAYGLINLEIGKGTLVTGDMGAIDWSAGPYFIKITVDGTEMGTSQLLSVPYALYSAHTNESDPKIGSNTTDYIPRWNGSQLTSGTILDNGKIGIDNASPAFKLDVNGSINVPVDSGYRIDNRVVLSTKGLQNVFVGTFAGSYSTGYFNSFLGYQAGNANLGGNYNNFVGYQAGYSNTTGGGNNYIGRFAGFSGTNAFWNTFLGDRAGYNCVSSRNTFIGADAGYSVAAGQYNCYLGVGAGFSNTSGSYGCYYGYQAGYNTTSNYNNFIGYQAGYTNTTGMGNSFFGRLSGYSNIGGAWNTFIGDRAGTNNASGSQNIFIGSDVGLSNTAGNYNTLIGNGSDVSTASLTNATAIGYNAVVNGSNKIRLGNTSVTVIEGQVAYTYPSDMRLKKNINDIGSGLDFIMKLRPVEFQMRQGDDRINFGFIAQDIEKLLGTNNSILTIGEDKDRTLGLRYTDFISPMVKAMQEQQKQIETQQKQIEELKDALDKLLETVNELKNK
jgi:trimeric autotransporter adhesin